MGRGRRGGERHSSFWENMYNYRGLHSFHAQQLDLPPADQQGPHHSDRHIGQVALPWLNHLNMQLEWNLLPQVLHLSLGRVVRGWMME